MSEKFTASERALLATGIVVASVEAANLGYIEAQSNRPTYDENASNLAITEILLGAALVVLTIKKKQRRVKQEKSVR